MEPTPEITGPEDESAASARNIPEEVKRRVRQECRFGCVICGMPIFEYDHIDDFSEVREHNVTNIALLCPNHHRDKTAGRLSRESVRAARAAPFNGQKTETESFGLQAALYQDIMVGSNVTVVPANATNHHVIWINGEPFFTVHREGTGYTCSANLTDERGQTLLKIDHGKITVSTDVWDYRYEGRTVSIRRALGDILLEAEMTDQRMRIYRGAFIDHFETGILIEASGDVALTLSGLQVGKFAGLGSANMLTGAFAIRRQSCFGGDIPDGFGFAFSWGPEKEEEWAEMRRKLEQGEPVREMPGLASFRPFPRQ